MDHNSHPLLSGEKNKSKKKIPVDGYEADLENTKKILPTAPKKPRKSKRINIISKQETSNPSKTSATDDNPILKLMNHNINNVE